MRLGTIAEVPHGATLVPLPALALPLRATADSPLALRQGGAKYSILWFHIPDVATVSCTSNTFRDDTSIL